MDVIISGQVEKILMIQQYGTFTLTRVEAGLKTHAHTTIALHTKNGQAIHLRVPGVPDHEQRQIYALLGVDYIKLPRRHLTFH